jgi:5-methylthioadenosine/S-adenosylhomocysteine deaminase
MKLVDTLLVGGAVVTMNEAFDVFLDGAVAIHETDIVAVGSRDEVLSHYQSQNVIDCTGMYIMPGFVNAHTHAAMTLLRGMADDRRLDVWLMGYMMPVEREFVSEAFCRLGTQLACAEMIRSGVTAFADMYYHESVVAAATADAGMRGVLGESVLKFPAPDAGSYHDSLRYTRAFIEEWKGHSLITPAVAPHAPYSNTDETLRLCVDIATEYDVPLLIHVAETRLEVDNSLTEHGMTVVDRLKALGLFSAKVLAAHCVHIAPDEIPVLHDEGASVAHCPTSNLKLASGIAPIAQLLKGEVIVGIGTDGPASNNDLDMFEEVRLAAVLAKAATNDPTTLPARQALLMATRQGAQALFIGDITGSLEVGKRADVMVMDARPLHNMPQFDRDPNNIYSRIVYAGHASDVRHVWCNGRALMRDRALLTLDESAIIAQAQDMARRIDAFVTAREGDVLSKLLAIGGLEQGESFEVQVKASMPDQVSMDALLQHPDVQVVLFNHYRQYDTYFLFDDPTSGRVRYREDDKLNAHGEVENVRARLTYTTPVKEREFNNTILLSRSRFIAKADRPLRFYREYFRPSAERELEKDRHRWHLLYQGVLFYVNVDRVVKPELASDLPKRFLEIKSRTWSAEDAEIKARRIHDMLSILGVSDDQTIQKEYLQMIL